MKPKSPIIIFIISGLLLCNIGYTQSQLDEKPAKSEQTVPEGTKMNIVKLNLPALALTNFSLQYERVISKRFSAALGFRFMPNTGLPFKNTFVNAAGTSDPDAETLIRSLKVSNFALTPEVRFYVGKKGYGRGFYIAPYYRFAKFNADQVSLNYESGPTTTNTIKLKGDITTNSGGLMFGAQWHLGGAITLDWWIMGAHYGKSVGILNGVPSTALTATEQQDIRDQINSIDMPFGKVTADVSANSVKANFDGPWAGIRGGLAIGFRF